MRRVRRESDEAPEPLEVIDAEDVLGAAPDPSLPEILDLPTGPVAFRGRVRDRRGLPWPLAATAFAVVLLGGVWVAGLGAIGDQGRATTPPAPWLGILGGTPAPTPLVTPADLAELGGLEGDAVWLLSPAAERPTVTTRAVRVDGLAASGASSVEVALEARGNRVLDSVVVDVDAVRFGPGGAAGRAGTGTPFSVAFDLPFPRPNGTMWIVATAYDRSGIPLGGIRRAFLVGELLPMNAASGVAP